MNKTFFFLITIFVLVNGASSSFGQAVSKEARRHFDRGMAAVELAKSPDDYAAAIEEFEKAAKLAPDWPGIYYNLGLIQEKAGNYSNAVMSLLRYIHLAPNASDAETVKSLINKLEYKFELLYKENGYSLLHDVARNNNKEGAELLIAKGADINAKDNDGETPLHNAINSNSMEVVELLIVNGADLDAKDNAGYSPLHKAIISQVSKEVIELLISNGVDINIKNQFGCIPLHYAARGGQKEVVELLIANGTNVKARDDNQLTPLHEAAIGGHLETVGLLITKGADINAKDNTGTTPLHYAVFQLRKEVVELLLGNGADINAKDNKGKTALFYAINVDKGLAKLLKEHGAK
jgi:ankyrin repeat protein